MAEKTKSETPATPANGRIGVPEGEILVRKVRGPDGIHERIGWAKVGRIYTVGDRWAARMVEGGEFECVYEDDKVRVAAMIDAAKLKVATPAK